MRYLILLFAAAASVLSTAPAHADLRDELAKLLAGDGEVEDSFGYSVAISGATAIVGALGDDDNGTNSGSAYLFDTSDPANPTQIAKLLPSDGAENNWFGCSVAISDTIAIIGALVDDDNGAQSGSAYLFD
ncbi:MAG: FG-GAP repeat protein, partial [Phycisphaerales bacterium]|nr:FG-GAP repeat protein [Phycisphaerales bacterium]